MFRKEIIWLVLVIFHFLSCDNNKLEKLVALDDLILEFNQLEHFTSLKVSNKFINYQAVCISDICKETENNLEKELEKLGISLDSFNNIESQMNSLGLIAFFKIEEYSFWVNGGALGDVSGFAISHGEGKNIKRVFKLDNRYNVEIGKMLKENIYYFSG